MSEGAPKENDSNPITNKEDIPLQNYIIPSQEQMDKAKEIFESPGEHADELETSVGMALFGNLVHVENASNGSTRKSRFEAINKGWVSIARPWHLVTKDSTYGDPRKASKEKGEAYLRIVVERISEYIVELAKSRMDAKFPY